MNAARRATRRKRAQPVWWVGLLLLLVAIVRGLTSLGNPDPPSPPSPRADAPVASSEPASRPAESRNRSPRPTEERYEVVRVVDGDTLVVRSEQDPSDKPQRLRLLGINSPESVKPDHPVEPWGPEASQFTRQFLEDAATVRLVFDQRRYDQYDRLLAYVYVGDRMLNEELVRAGLARVSVYDGDSEKMADRLYEAQREAKRNRNGIWSSGPAPRY